MDQDSAPPVLREHRFQFRSFSLGKEKEPKRNHCFSYFPPVSLLSPYTIPLLHPCIRGIGPARPSPPTTGTCRRPLTHTRCTRDPGFGPTPSILLLATPHRNTPKALCITCEFPVHNTPVLCAIRLDILWKTLYMCSSIYPLSTAIHQLSTGYPQENRSDLYFARVALSSFLRYTFFVPVFPLCCQFFELSTGTALSSPTGS